MLGTTTFDYDSLGALVGATLPDGRVLSYVLDPRGRRVGKRVNGSLVEGFVYDDSLRPVAQLDGSGAVIAEFVYGTARLLPDYMLKGGARYRLLLDLAGSAHLVVDADTGAVAQRIDFDPFGQVLADTNPGFQPFGFGGALFDRDTGLVHLGAREYDPSIGRFTSPDPAGFGGGDTNLYAFAASDPVNLTDPDGNESVANFLNNFVLAVRPDDSALLRGVADLARSTPWAQHISDHADELVRRNTPNPCSTGAAIGGAINAAEDLWGAYGAYSLGRWGISRILGRRRAVVEGIYEFPEGNATYVGQSANIPNRLQQHVDAGRIGAPSQATATEVLGGKTVREIAEYRRIREITGDVPARLSDKVSNKVDPIGKKRRRLLGLE